MKMNKKIDMLFETKEKTSYLLAFYFVSFKHDNVDNQEKTQVYYCKHSAIQYRDIKSYVFII
jgi:cytochrome oxidase Cu insertion factor (SCO1/SenC/PrrC family)